MEEKERIVLLVGSYWPNYSATGRCMGNLAEELVRRGHEVTVICQRTAAGEAAEEVYRSQRIVRIGGRAVELDLYCRERGGAYQLLRRAFQAQRLCAALLPPNSVDRRRVRWYLSALERLPFVPDRILPVCFPFDTVIAALDYKASHPACKVMPSLYDMFAINGRLQRFGWNMRWKLRANQRLERRMLLESDRVLHLPSWTPYLDKYHSGCGRTVEIEHPLVVRPASWGHVVYDSSKISAVYTGVVYRYIRDPMPVLSLLGECFGDRLDVHCYTYGSGQRLVAAAAARWPCIHSHGQVSSQKAHAAMVSGDILLSIGNRHTVQMPSKIFAYISTGHPVVHFAFDARDPSIGVLERYPLGTVVRMDSAAEDQAAAFSEVLDRAKERLSFDEVSALYPEAVPGRLADQAFELLPPPPPARLTSCSLDRFSGTM